LGLSCYRQRDKQSREHESSSFQGVTVIAAESDFPSTVAVIVAMPTATPVTWPLVSTVATEASLVVHTTVIPLKIFPFVSLTVAVSDRLLPTRTLADEGVTVTLPTGRLSTVMVAEPLFPSLVAVIVAEPSNTPVTSPAADTVATSVAVELQTTVRPVRTLLLASVNVADSVVVASMLMVAEAGDTATAATGAGVTVTVALPDFVSLVAVIVAAPSARPETTPVGETLAIDPALELHVTVRPTRTFPAPSLTTAASVPVRVAGTLSVGGVTVTLATGAAVTVMVAVPT
jgi:hypothetical protein